MDAEKRNLLLHIASGELYVAALIFLVISLSGKVAGNWPLAAALGCVVLAGIFQAVRRQALAKGKKGGKP